MFLVNPNMLAAVVHSSRTLHSYIHRRIFPTDSVRNSPKKLPFLRDFFLWQTGHLKKRKEKENVKKTKLFHHSCCDEDQYMHGKTLNNEQLNMPCVVATWLT